MMNDSVFVVIGAFAAFLLQVLLAPHIAIGTAVPNFMAAYCLAVAVVRAGSMGPALPFVMGLAFDLISGAPVGAMAFSLTAFCTFASWLFRRTDNDTVFMAVASIAAGTLLAEVTVGVLYLASGYSAGFVEALAYRALPCFVYDFALAAVIYLAGRRFLSREVAIQSEITQI